MTSSTQAGSLTGGSRQQKEAGFLSRGKEIDEQEQKAGQLRHELLGYQEQLEEHENTLKIYNTKLAELRQDLQQKEIRKAELAVALERLGAEQRQASERLELLLDDRNQASQEYMAARQQLTDLRPQLTELEAQDAQGKELLDGLQKQTAADHSALTSIRSRLQDARVELESTAARTAMMAERMQQLDADMGRTQQELAANDDEQKHLLDIIATSKTSSEQLGSQSTALLAELQTIVGGKDEFGAKRLAITEKQAVAGERLDALKKELTVAETKRNQAAMEMVRQNSDYDHALEQLATEYRITLEEARASGDLLDESDVSLRRRELRLERDIEALGPVNPAPSSNTKPSANATNFCSVNIPTFPKPKPIWKPSSARSTPAWPNALKKPSARSTNTSPTAMYACSVAVLLPLSLPTPTTF